MLFKVLRLTICAAAAWVLGLVLFDMMDPVQGSGQVIDGLKMFVGLALPALTAWVLWGFLTVSHRLWILIPPADPEPEPEPYNGQPWTCGYCGYEHSAHEDEQCEAIARAYRAWPACLQCGGV